MRWLRRSRPPLNDPSRVSRANSHPRRKMSRPRQYRRSIHVLPFLVILASFPACSKADQGRGPIGKASAESGQYGRTDKEPVIELDAKTRENLHLGVQLLTPVAVQPEVKGYGRVLDPAPLSAHVADLASAQAALAASEKEYQRLKTLVAGDNASARALEAARAAAERDRLRVQFARQRIALSWGGTLLRRSDLQDLVSSLAALEQVVVRVDLPAGEPLVDDPAAARLVSLHNESRSATAEFVSHAPSTNPQMQGQGFLFLLRTNSLHLAPGSTVTGYLELRGQPLRGVVVPATAVVRYEERAWVYLQQSPDSFARKPIVLESPRDRGWLVTHGLRPGDRIVVDGAQLLLSEELKSQIHLGD